MPYLSTRNISPSYEDRFSKRQKISQVAGYQRIVAASSADELSDRQNQLASMSLLGLGTDLIASIISFLSKGDAV